MDIIYAIGEAVFLSFIVGAIVGATVALHLSAKKEAAMRKQEDTLS